MLWSCLLTLAFAAAPATSAVGLNDEVQTGRLIAITGDRIQLQTASGDVKSLSITDLRSLQFPDVPAPSPFADPPSITVTLIDGSQLAAVEFLAQGTKVQVTLEDLGQVELPRAAVRGVRLGNPDKVAPRWDELLGRETQSDLLVRRKQDVLDFVEGSIGDIAAAEFSFLVGDRTVAVPRDRVFGIILAHKPTELARAIAEVRVGRNRLQARELKVQEGEIQVQLAAADVALTLPLDRIHQVEFAGRVKYLGELEPLLSLPEGIGEEERHRYFRRGSEPFGGPLRVGSDEVVTREGLWMHSGVTARYRINRDYRRLTALVGMDHNVGGNRSVRLILTGDGRTLYDQVIEYSQPAQEIDLDVSDVRDLEIRVERLPESRTTNLFAVQEHLDLGQIRLIR